MSSVPLHYVELRAFCNATEDEDRVEAALRTFLPEDADLQAARSEGHFGDPITIFSTRLERADEIRTVLDRIAELPEDDYAQVVDELDERVDEDCNLFLTLDKQAAYGGDVRLGDGITLRGKVEAYPAKQPAAVENARELLEER